MGHMYSEHEWADLNDLEQSVSDEELVSLGHYLKHNSLPGGCSSLVMADGFLTALAAGPVVIPRTKHQGFHLAWGEVRDRSFNGGRWPTNQKKMLSILSRRFSDVSYYIALNRNCYTPIVNLHRSDLVNYEYDISNNILPPIISWCKGYMKAVMLCPIAWLPIYKTQRSRNLFAPFSYFGLYKKWGGQSEYMSGCYHFEKNLPQYVLAVRDCLTPSIAEIDMDDFFKNHAPQWRCFESQILSNQLPR